MARTRANGDDEQQQLRRLADQLAALREETRRSAGYLARQELEGLRRSLAHQPRRLELAGFKVYSQSDEDGILQEIFARLGVAQGTFCEIGVENGLECNTLFLLHHGWRGAWLEASARHGKTIRQKFGALLRNGRLALRVGYVTPENVDAAIAETLGVIGLNGAEPDLLSIDVDGMDIHLLAALRVRPKVLCIEYNAKFPPPLDKRPVFDPAYAWTGGDYAGSSLVALERVARGQGYRLVSTHFSGVNAFFVREDLLEERFDLLPVEALYHPPRYHLIWDHFSSAAGHRADFGPYEDLA